MPVAAHSTPLMTVSDLISNNGRPLFTAVQKPPSNRATPPDRVPTHTTVSKMATDVTLLSGRPSDVLKVDQFNGSFRFEEVRGAAATPFSVAAHMVVALKARSFRPATGTPREPR